MIAVAVVGVDFGLDDAVEPGKAVAQNAVVAGADAKHDVVVVVRVATGFPLEAGAVAHTGAERGVAVPLGDEEGLASEFHVEALDDAVPVVEEVVQLAEVAGVGDEGGLGEEVEIGVHDFNGAKQGLEAVLVLREVRCQLVVAGV